MQVRLGRPLTRLGGVLAAVIALASTSVYADTPRPSALEQVAGLEVSAVDTVRWLGFRVFDIKVFTQGGRRYDPSKQAAVELHYGRRFSQQSLMQATMEEFARLENPQSDHGVIARKLKTCFADVNSGDRFLAVGLAKDQVDLFRNDIQTCRLTHPNIRERFLDIWLSTNSRFPAVSRRLRGL